MSGISFVLASVHSMNGFMIVHLVLLLTALYSTSAFAAPDFNGLWQTKSGWADEYEGWGAVHYTDCAMFADINLKEEKLSVCVGVKCASESGQILKQYMPPQDFSVDANGKLNGPTGSGRITGNQFQLKLPDAYDGTHYVLIKVLNDKLMLDWGYEGEEGSSFEISGGKKGLTKKPL